MKKLKLGRELSKNDQKKIIGGDFICCSNGDGPFYTSSCSAQNANAYCQATSRGTGYCCG